MYSLIFLKLVRTRPEKLSSLAIRRIVLLLHSLNRVAKTRRTERLDDSRQPYHPGAFYASSPLTDKKDNEQPKLE